MLWSKIGLNRWVVALTLGLRPGVTILPASLQQDAAGFGTIRGRRSQRTSHGGKAPFLHISFDENKSSLAEVDVDCCGSVGADSGEKVLVLHSVAHIVQLLAVPSEEDATCSGTVPAADDIPLNDLRPIRCMVEWLIQAPETVGEVGSRVLVEACHKVSNRELLIDRDTGSKRIPGSLKSGYGLVAIPMATRVASGFSYTLASQ